MATCPIPGGCGLEGVSHGSQDACLEALRVLLEHGQQHPDVVSSGLGHPNTKAVHIRRLDQGAARTIGFYRSVTAALDSSQVRRHARRRSHRSILWIESQDPAHRAWVPKRGRVEVNRS